MKTASAIKTQSKAQAERKAKTVAKRINQLSTKTAVDRWKIAEQMHTLYVGVPWRVTSYKSFKQFALAELTMPESTASNYSSAHANRIKLNYTDKEIRELSVAFPFTTLTKIFRLIPKKQAVSLVIRKYKQTSAHNENAIRFNHKSIPSSDNKFGFVLDETYSSLLDQVLRQHGMSKTKSGKRLGLTPAICSLLDAITLRTAA